MNSSAAPRGTVPVESAARGRDGDGRTRRLLPLLVLLTVCAIPHLLRLAFPVASMSDGFYGHAALMFARGYEPYVDFTQVAFPLAETILGAAIRMGGADIRVIELVNKLFVLGVAAALFGAGRRMQSNWTGAVAALAWSYGTWVLHFNLFERETWAALGTALALLAYFGSDVITPRRALFVAGGLLLAFCMKITAVMAAAGLCVHLALCGRWREMWRLGLTYSAGVLLVTLACWARYGDPFLWQVYVFGFFRNQQHGTLESLGFVVLHSDPFMLAGWVALVLYGLRRLRRPAGALVCVLALDLVYATVISPVVWDHNMINFVVPLSLLLGGGLDHVLSGRDADRRARQLHVGLAGLTAVVLFVLGLDVFTERRFINRELADDWRPARYGFGITGGRDRGWLQAQADFVRSHTEPEDVIACLEPWIAFQADRVKFVRYWDLQPVAMGVEASLAADGLRATLAKRGERLLLGPGMPEPDPRALNVHDPYLARLYANGLAHVRPRLLDGLARGAIALVLEPLPPGILTEADLRRAGYERRTGAHGLAAWLAPPGRAAASRKVLPIYAR